MWIICMGILSFFQRKEKFEDKDHILAAEEFESKGDYLSAIKEYEILILTRFSDKPSKFYRHLTKKIITDYVNLGNYEKVLELWPTQYDSSDYGPQEMQELIKILEIGQRNDLIEKVYAASGKKLLKSKLEFLIKMRKIPEANALVTEILANFSGSGAQIEYLWLTKAKLCLSLRKWEESNKYLNKILEQNSHHEEARRLKEFCFKQLRSS